VCVRAHTEGVERVDIIVVLRPETLESVVHALRKDINRAKYMLKHGQYSTPEQKRLVEGNLDMARAALADIETQEKEAYGKFAEDAAHWDIHETTCDERDQAALAEAPQSGLITVLRTAEQAEREAAAEAPQYDDPSRYRADMDAADGQG
jgi:hypothetical protein